MAPVEGEALGQRELNRALLQRQLLLRRVDIPVERRDVRFEAAAR
jgi:hypothetical protein